MSIIQELQDDVINQEVSLTPVLLKARILAYRLRHDEFKKWVDNELDGYPDKDSIPRYRRYTAQNYGEFFGPFRRHESDVLIPTIHLPDPIREFAQGISMGQGVGSLEDLKNHPDMIRDGTVKYTWPPDVVAVAAQHEIHEDRFPELKDSNDRIGEVPPEQTTIMFNTHIHGSQNVVAAVTNITQDVRQVVRSNDLSSLLSCLKSIGVSEEDVQELKEAVEKDEPRTEPGDLGHGVRGWLGKRMAEGALNATLSSIAMIAAKAVAQYYGWLT